MSKSGTEASEVKFTVQVEKKLANESEDGISDCSSVTSVKTIPQESTLVWDCVLNANDYYEKRVEKQNHFIELAEKAKWKKLFAYAKKDGNHEYVNCVRITPMSRETPGLKNSQWTALHHAASQGVELKIVASLFKLGACRAVRTAKGETPLDFAKLKGHEHLYEILGSPPDGGLLKGVSLEEMAAIDEHFATIVERYESLTVPMETLRLCPVAVFREYEKVWMAIPGMYGGFNLEWEEDHLVSESYVRICGGSGRTYHITAAGAELVASGWG